MSARIASNEELLRALRDGVPTCYFGSLEYLPADIVVERIGSVLDVILRFRRPFKGVVLANIKRGSDIQDINVVELRRYVIEARVPLHVPSEPGEYEIQVTYSGTMLYNLIDKCIEERPTVSPPPRGVVKKIRIQAKQ